MIVGYLHFTPRVISLLWLLPHLDCSNVQRPQQYLGSVFLSIIQINTEGIGTLLKEARGFQGLKLILLSTQTTRGT